MKDWDKIKSKIQQHLSPEDGVFIPNLFTLIKDTFLISTSGAELSSKN